MCSPAQGSAPSGHSEALSPLPLQQLWGRRHRPRPPPAQVSCKFPRSSVSSGPPARPLDSRLPGPDFQAGECKRREVNRAGRRAQKGRARASILLDRCLKSSSQSQLAEAASSRQVDAAAQVSWPLPRAAQLPGKPVAGISFPGGRGDESTGGN